jgi:hypothetical protein
MRIHEVDVRKDTFDKPLIVFKPSTCESNIYERDEQEQLKFDALQSLVDVELLIVEAFGCGSAAHDKLAELKLRLFGSVMAF